MLGRVWLLLAIVALTPMQQSIAGEPRPICREPKVLDAMSLELRKRSYYSRVVPDLVWEQPTGARDIIRCGVCVAVTTYDMQQFGVQPVAACEQHAFDVQTLLNGFVVRYLH